MSNVVVAHSHKAENTVYLAYSIVVVTLFLYLIEWLQGHATGPGFVPNVIVILTLSPVLAAALVYSSPDEQTLHRVLRHSASGPSDRMEKDVLLLTYVLRLYRVPTWNLLNQAFVVSQVRDMVLESGDLDTRIWKLRGAIWFLFSIPPSVLIVCSAYGWSQSAAVMLVLIAVTAAVMVAAPSLKSFRESVLYLHALTEFHLLDRGLSVIRRWEASSQESISQSQYEAKGLSESIYRALKAAAATDSTKAEKILRPTIEMHGDYERRIEEPVRISTRHDSTGWEGKAETARFHDMVYAECEWLRELARRERWATFRARLQDLKIQMLGQAEIALQKVHVDLMREWMTALKAEAPAYPFQQLRTLCNRLLKRGMVPGALQEIVEKLLTYHDRHVLNLSWTLHYWDRFLDGHEAELFPILHDGCMEGVGTTAEGDMEGDFYADMAADLKDMEDRRGSADVTFEDSEKMVYE